MKFYDVFSVLQSLQNEKVLYDILSQFRINNKKSQQTYKVAFIGDNIYFRLRFLSVNSTIIIFKVVNLCCEENFEP